MLPTEAVIPVVPTSTRVTVPSVTVATVVLVEVQTAICVTSTGPLHVVADAVIGYVPMFMETLWVPTSDRVIDSMQPTLTVSTAEPVIVPFCTDVAVIVV